MKTNFVMRGCNIVMIETIKQRICDLDQGSFQNLCDEYLVKIGYPNIVSLGMKPGTRKTTKGTPDTYFCTPSGQYVFAEYTTQKSGLFNKAKSDIQGCLDVTKTKTPLNKISEIIYCHTSSNITPAQDNELKSLCADVGINLTIIGIDRLATDLYLNHPRIVHKCLNLPIDTGQIQAPEDFIKDYNSKKTAAALDTEFVFREKELTRIHEAYQDNSIVVLTGSAGAGKTRIALQYMEKYAQHSKCYCIHNKALNLYEDIKITFDTPGSYFIMIDDANQLSDLPHIAEYTTKQPEGYDVKILITARSYAAPKVFTDINKITSYSKIDIGTFTEDEIKELVKKNFCTLNQRAIERIVTIADGNARFAIIAGKVAQETDRLDSIHDASQLYDDYYGTYLNDNVLATDNDWLVTAGIVAFLGVIHLDHMDSLIPVLASKSIDKDTFIENVRKLHEIEMVDVCKDKVVRFSEQCLSNFLLKYVYFDKRLLNLHDMIKICFKSHRQRVIFSINTLMEIFRNKLLHEFVVQEIKKLWDELAQEESEYLDDFIKVFFRVNPTEALIVLQREIDKSVDVPFNPSDVDAKKGNQYYRKADDIIEMLGGFADMAELPLAVDLFFIYFQKRPDLFAEFCQTIKSHYGINKDYQILGCATQITFFEKFIEYSEGWKNYAVTTLFLEVADEFLKWCFSPTESSRKANTISWYTFNITLTDGVKAYRKLIWESLLSISQIDKYRDKVRSILSSYGSGSVRIGDMSDSVLLYDFPYIQSIVEKSYLPSDLKSCLMVKKITQIYKDFDETYNSSFSQYFTGKQYQLYQLLKEPDILRTELGVQEYDRLKRQTIEEYLTTNSVDEIFKMIDICCDLEDIRYDITAGLNAAFDALISKGDAYVEVIKYYLRKDTPCNSYPLPLVKALFTNLNDMEVYSLIYGFDYREKNAWLYAYFHELPQEYINKEALDSLYAFLSDRSDENIRSSVSRNVVFLEKYSVVEKQAFINGCRIILDKINYSPFMVDIYFGLLFNRYSITPQEVMQKFDGHLDLLTEIYSTMLMYDSSHDNDGYFLKEIYLVHPPILDKYIYCMSNKQTGSFNDYSERTTFFFELDNFKEVFSYIIDELMKNLPYPTTQLPYYLKSLLSHRQGETALSERQDSAIEYYIQSFSDDIEKMYCLFESISNCVAEIKAKYWLLFFEYNDSFEDFQQLPLTPMSYGATGSMVPVYRSWIDFLKKLLPHLSSLKWLKHKKRIETRIQEIKAYIEQTQIDEMLRG